MHISHVRPAGTRVVVIAAMMLACAPAICHAQESSPLSPSTLIAIDTPLDTRDPVITRAPETSRSPRLGAMLPLYASFATLQALDAHSTTRALRNGGIERNPLLGDLADRPAALYALKAGVTASTIFLTEKLRVKHRVGAIVLMAALDSFYATVVIHNYRATR